MQQQDSGDIGLGVAKTQQKAIKEEFSRPAVWRKEKAISRNNSALAALLVFIFTIFCLTLPLYTPLSLSVAAVLAVVVPMAIYSFFVLAKTRRLRRLREQHVKDLK